MIKKIASFFLLSIVGLTSYANNPVSGPVSLELKPSVGTKVNYTLVENTNTSISAMGQDMNMTSNSSTEYAFVARKDSAGLKTFTAILKSTVKEMDMGAKININTIDPKADTGSSPSGALTKFYKHLAGLPYSIYLNKAGKVVSTTGAKEISQNAASQIDLTGPMAALKSMANESILTTDLDKIFDFTPEKAVQVGDKWNRNDTVAANGMPMHFATIYILSKVEGDVATIKANSTISFDGELEAAQGASAKIMGTAVGTFTVNTATGLMISSDGDLVMEIKLNQGGMEMPMKVSTKATITSK